MEVLNISTIPALLVLAVTNFRHSSYEYQGDALSCVAACSYQNKKSP